MMRKTPLEVVFFRTDSGVEPAREWLKNLPKQDRKTIGEDIKTAQYGWPLGMPLVKKVDKAIWEIRSHIKNRIARVLVTTSQNHIVILHGFIKKTMKIPKNDLAIARKRLFAIRSSK